MVVVVLLWLGRVGKEGGYDARRGIDGWR